MNVFLSALIQGLAFTGLGIGIFLSLKIFNIPDITTDGSFTLGGAVAGILLSSGYNPFLAFLLAACCGSLAGIATGIIHTRLKIHPLLAGILVMTALYSINLFIMGKSNIPLIESQNIFHYVFFDDGQYNQLFICMLYSILLLICISYLLKTDFGIAMRATGSSECMAIANGINTEIMKIKGLAIANGLTALCGSLLVQFQGYADINMGIGIVVSGLAAVILGESLLGFFKTKTIIHNLIFVVAGTIIFRLLLAAALLSGMPPQALKLITSLIVLSVVALFKISKKETA
jgi:putative ABC transport system permease protein